MNFRWLLAIAAVFALGGAFWLGRITPTEESMSASTRVGPSGRTLDSTPTPTSTTAAAAAQPSNTVASNVGQAAAATSASVALSAPLPALDAPLADMIEDLHQRADAGDARAACRLAAELRKCELADVELAYAQQASRMLKRIQQDPPTGAARPNEEQFKSYAANMASQVDHAVATSEHCAGVKSSSPSEQFRYWRQAALAGHLSSMTMYASGNIFRLRNSLAQLPDFEIYRHEAERIARSAALAGDKAALFALISAYAPQHDQLVLSLLAQATGANSVETLSMLLLAQKRGLKLPSQTPQNRLMFDGATSIDEAIAVSREALNPEQISHAEHLASERHANYPVDPGVESAVQTLLRPPADDSLRERCESEAFAPVAPPAASG